MIAAAAVAPRSYTQRNDGWLRQLSLVGDVRAAMHAELHLSQSTDEAMAALSRRLHASGAMPPGVAALCETWGRAMDAQGLREGDLHHAALRLLDRLEAGQPAMPGGVAMWLYAVQYHASIEARAWQAVRNACCGPAGGDAADELAALCADYDTRRQAQTQATARLHESLHCLVLELVAAPPTGARATAFACAQGVQA
jgi:hypothetical protein